MDTRVRLSFAPALREVFKEGYRLPFLKDDLIAGITVGIIAVPLAMALAIASGVPPQHGLYTAIVAGIIVALCGGSRLGIAGPTAAFVVLLHPITIKYGIGGLFVVTIMAGVFQILLGISKMGRLIQFIPYPVTTGFTSGIAVVIAFLQLKDFLGLTITEMPLEFWVKVEVLVRSLPSIHLPDLAIGVLTLGLLIVWQRLKIRIPGHLPILVTVSFIAWSLSGVVSNFDVATIGSRFSYVLEGKSFQGIPPLAPRWILPWNMPDAYGQPIGLSIELFQNLLFPAIGVALLGAIESLLCAVVADGFGRTKHYPNSELVAQGIGNVIAPFLGGITATNAIARTTANFRAGARSPLASVFHAMTVLLVILCCGSLVAYIPMAALAGLLLLVAWNMAEIRHFKRIVRVAPKNDVRVLLICFLLTVLFDMVIAVGVGIVLSSLLFMQRMTQLSGVNLSSDKIHKPHLPIPKGVVLYNVDGPLFFGAAEQAINVMTRYSHEHKVFIIDMEDVPIIDMTGIVAFESLLERAHKDSIVVILCGLRYEVRLKLEKVGIRAHSSLHILHKLDNAVELATKLSC